MIQQNRRRSSVFVHLAPAILLLMLTAFTFLACKTTETRPVAIPKGFDWQGHRGCRGLMPENTIPAFLKALEFPEVTTLELDLAVSKDNKLIVSHEPWFNPEISLLPGGDSIKQKDVDRFWIYKMNSGVLHNFDVGSKGHPRFPKQQKVQTYKPLFLSAVAAVLQVRPDIRWNIEIKSRPEWDGLRHPPVEEFVALVVDAIRRLDITRAVTVQSFDVRALNALHRQAPELQLAFLIENIQGLESNLARLEFKPDIYSPYYLMVNKKLVEKCHDKQMKLVPWTVNDVKSMRRLIRLGVDGIITDYPDLIREVSGK
jgi:glycerophosphoryl diester phosphodiesterase